MKYVVFLRGINVGGNKKVPMVELRDILTDVGFLEVKTVLATGNIVLGSELKMEKVGEVVGAKIKEKFGFEVLVLVRSFEEVSQVFVENFFPKERAEKQKFYVVFGLDKFENVVVPDGAGFEVVGKNKKELFVVLDLKKVGTVDLMKWLDRSFGKAITVRDLNTVNRVLAL